MHASNTRTRHQPALWRFLHSVEERGDVAGALKAASQRIDGSFTAASADVSSVRSALCRLAHLLSDMASTVTVFDVGARTASDCAVFAACAPDLLVAPVGSATVVAVLPRSVTAGVSGTVAGPLLAADDASTLELTLELVRTGVCPEPVDALATARCLASSPTR